MRCDWNAFLSILPLWMKAEIDSIGRHSLLELRLRLNYPPELVLPGRCIWLHRNVCTEDLSHCINAASRYSPWASDTIKKGFLTAPGGHRIGLCGEAVMHNGTLENLRAISSLCIRVARDFSGISKGISCDGSLLILGAPGWGKTTLLRDWIRNRSEDDAHIAVVDERGELFPSAFSAGRRTDVLTGCTKPEGISLLLRSMGPSAIAVDEITDQSDCMGLLHAHGCGVKLYATAHAASMEDFLRRKVYEPLIANNVFHSICILHADKTWHMERMA